jgi:hypothetical protein
MRLIRCISLQQIALCRSLNGMILDCKAGGAELRAAIEILAMQDTDRPVYGKDHVGQPGWTAQVSH